MKCECCGAENVKFHKHHESYEDVCKAITTLLCIPCHRQRHVELKKNGINLNRRLASGKISFTARIHPELLAWADEESKKRLWSRGQYIEHLIRKEQNREQK